MQVVLDGIVTSVGEGVLMHGLAQYGAIEGHKLGKAVQCVTPTLKDVFILVAMSFMPLRTDGNDPCRFEIEKALWTMLVIAYHID